MDARFFYSFRLNNGAKITGTITAEDDIKVVNAWSRGKIADVNAHGHTVYCNPGSKNTPIEFTGAVDASFEKGDKGGKLDVKSGVRARVAELWVDGVKQPDGTYRASAVPAGATVTGASFTGAGTIRVGDIGAFLIIR